MTTDGSEKELVKVGRDGDANAYSVLVKRHYRRVFVVCLGMLENVHNAQDAAQDTFVRGFERLGRIRKSEVFGSWIVKIARNICIDFIRRQKRSRDILAQKAAQSNANNSNSSRDDLEAAIGQLPMELRGPLVMYYFENRSTKSIAQMLNISHTGVCQRLRKARKQLHEFLTKRDL